jgi:hypothetical protein
MVTCTFLRVYAQVAVHISPHKMLAQDRGLVVVGLSVARGDLASGEGLQRGAAGGDLLLGEVLLSTPTYTAVNLICDM